MDYLEGQGVVVELLVTDHHVQIKSYLTKNKPDIRKLAFARWSQSSRACSRTSQVW